MKKLLIPEGLKHLDRIISTNIISQYNYDGTKGKKYTYFLKALFGKYFVKIFFEFRNNIYTNIFLSELTKTEGQSYEMFVKELRSVLHRFKNRTNKAKNRRERKLKDSNKENFDSE